MPDGEVLIRDVFPAELLLPTGEIVTKARVFITSHRLIAWCEGADRLPYVAVELTLAEPPDEAATMMKGDPIVLVGLHGHAYVNKTKWCACGASLHALAPPAQFAARAS